jgi:preprotein translocase SecE subunit
MAVAVKNTPEAASPSLLDRMMAASLAGTAYVLGSLGIVFYLVPFLWQMMGWGGNVSAVVRGLVQLVVLSSLLVLGVRLLGSRAATGIRAGIFVGLLGFLTVLLLTRWFSLWIEYGSFNKGLFSPAIGSIITVVLGLALLALGIRFFLKPGTEKFLVRLEEQGWFSAKPYKPLQGLRVRRGTIFGILLLAGAGIWTLLSHNTLRKGPPDWQLDIPFTGRVTIEYPGDAKAELDKRFPNWESQIKDKTLVVDRYTLQEINQSVDPATHVKIFVPGAADFHTNEIVERAAYNETVRKLKESKETLPTIVAPQPAGGPTTFRTLTLLPAIQFTVPLLLLAVSLWLAWRIVNMPLFADFLIATEAEMNKVSWTTQRRLVQDTIVVLVTLVVMSLYLLCMDLTWRAVLQWPPIGVLMKQDEQDKDKSTNIEQRPW